MPIPVSDRVRKRRDALRAGGLRPVQVLAPETSCPGFAAECRRQSALIAESDRSDPDLSDCMDSALDDIEGWR